MIHLFPDLKKRMISISIAYIVLMGVFIAINPGINPLFPLILALVGLFAVMFIHYVKSTNAHNRILNKLYEHLDVDGFLREYMPKTKLPIKNRNYRLMITLHISNAYCAQGRFDEAAELLRSFVIEDTKDHEDDQIARFAIVSNLCYCAAQKGDAETAQKYLDKLLVLRKELEAIQESKPAKKRTIFNTELNELILKYMTTNHVDVKALKTLIENNSQRLHRVTLSLWLARGYLTLNNRREAEKLLEQIVKTAPDLYPGREAAALLRGLPGRDDENA